MRNNFNAILLVFCSVFFIACSSEDNDQAVAEEGHVWEEQTETINKAKEVEGMLMDSATNMQNKIENQDMTISY